MDSRKRVTSHLSGLLYRNLNLLEAGIRPVYVFDGKPHDLKKGTIEERSAIKEKAQVEYEAALAEGDLEKARSKAQQTSRITKDMIEDSKKLLGLIGIPVVQAPMDGEGEAALLVQKGYATAVASQDFDSLLFGAPVLVRLLAQIAARFNTVVGEKIMAQGVPLVGAVGGATINLLFIDHFQDMARGHFAVRRLERAYGHAAVAAKYGEILRLRGRPSLD
jgi:5'-3' exonuclease